MFFISKKQFENEVRSRVEKELCRIEENRCKADELREVHRRCERLENRLEKIESMHGIPSNIEAKTFVI